MKNEKIEVEDILIVNVLGLCRLRDGNLVCNGDNTAFSLPWALETQERDRASLREYGFGSKLSEYRNRKDRRCARLRGHRCGKK